MPECPSTGGRDHHRGGAPQPQMALPLSRAAAALCGGAAVLGCAVWKSCSGQRQTEVSHESDRSEEARVEPEPDRDESPYAAAEQLAEVQRREAESGVVSLGLDQYEQRLEQATALHTSIAELESQVAVLGSARSSRSRSPRRSV